MEVVGENQARGLLARLDSLPQPYRENAVTWLQSCTRVPLKDLEGDMTSFLEGLHPIVRESFLTHTHELLDQAVHYFGV